MNMVHLLQLAAWAELALCWLLWAAAFLRPRQRGPRTVKVVNAPIARFGIFVNLLGFICIGLYVRPAGYEIPIGVIAAGMVLAPFSVLLAWRASLELGQHWRFDAALNDDHRLIRTGPYSRSRHPIYTSMVGMSFATGLTYTWWPLFLIGIIFILLGIDIRVRAEDKLMEQFFQDEFIEYRAMTRAYWPFF